MVIFDSDSLGICISDPISKYQNNLFGHGQPCRFFEIGVSKIEL